MAPKKKTSKKVSSPLKEELAEKAAAGESLSVSQKRLLRRRDTDDEVSRVIENTLAPRYTAESITSCVGLDGLTVRAFIEKGLKQAHATGHRLATGFWIAFNDNFNLDEHATEGLGAPPEANEPVRSCLIEALKKVHDKNPAARDITPFLEFLKEVDDFNFTEFTGILKAVKVGPKVGRQRYVDMMLAVLTYVGRTVCEVFNS